MATTVEKPVMVVGVDDSEQSSYALEWTLDRFFVPFSSSSPFKLVVIHAKPIPTSIVKLSGHAAAEIIPHVDIDLKRVASKVVKNAKDLCATKLVNDVVVEVIEGDSRNVLCEAVEKHHAAILVVGSHGYGAIKRAVLGSVSDYCAHHAHCSVMIVKKPKIKH